jgi:hypothetical protein
VIATISADLTIHQRTRDRRNVGDQAARRFGFVLADNPPDVSLAVLTLDSDSRAETDARGVATLVHHTRCLSACVPVAQFPGRTGGGVLVIGGDRVGMLGIMLVDLSVDGRQALGRHQIGGG